MQLFRNKRLLVGVMFASAAIFLCVRGVSLESVSADTASDLQERIRDIQKQIDQYSNLLDSTSKESKTLEAALKTLELTRKKLEANLALTTTNISKTTLTLSELNKEIKSTEKEIAEASAVIAQSMREISMAESQSVVESFLGSKSISETWNYVNGMHTIQSKMKVKFDELHDLRQTLNIKKDKATGEKTKLLSYQKSLTAEKQAVLATKDEKEDLLKETSGKEAEYKKILSEKIALGEQYERELFAYESKLQASTGAVPAARTGMMDWPLESVKITQYFGKTVSAKRLYVSGTHNGIDFKASVGTPVKAALSGIVTDTEPTKSKSGCQYGKYVLIKHPNGLSTIYGHLSAVSVKPGDAIVIGDTIGLSGNTGYSTGPHLHFGVYVTSGVRVVDSSALGSKACSGIKTVASPTSGYLDPLSYLPKL